MEHLSRIMVIATVLMLASASFGASAQTTVTLPKGTVGVAYSESVISTASTVTLHSGKLPPGLSIVKTKDGYSLQGAPTEAGKFTFTLTVMHSGASITCSITIDDPTPITVTGPANVAITESQTATFHVTASGGDGPLTYKWEVDFRTGIWGVIDNTYIGYSGWNTGELKLTYSAYKGSTGVIAYYRCTVSDGRQSATTEAATLTVNAGIPPTITTDNIWPPFVVGQSPISHLNASGTAPFTWSVISGSLPDGMELEEDIGRITGTFTKAGTFNFTVKATNNFGFGTKDFSMTVSSRGPSITTKILQDGVIGTAYSETLEATSDSPVTWSMDGAGTGLPPGLSLNSNGVISGMPSAAGTFRFAVFAKNTSSPYSTISGWLTITIFPTFTAHPADREVTAGEGTTFTATATGGTTALDYSWLASMDDGMSWGAVQDMLVAGTFSGHTASTLTLTGIPETYNNYKFFLLAQCEGTISASSNVATLTVNGNTTYHIGASPGELQFGSLPAPYVQPAARTVTVENTGTGMVTLAQPAAAGYTVGALSTVSLAAGAKATFTVQPKAGLTAAAYNETITVSGSNGTGATVAVSFTVTEAAVVDAQTPVIDSHPQSATYNLNEAAAALTVAASVADGGTLSYRWYVNTVNSNSGGTSINGAGAQSFTPPTAEAGTVYYYAEATNTNSAATGAKTASATSGVAKITVNGVAATKTVHVGVQSGVLTAGTVETVTFPVWTANISDGRYPATVANLPAGVTVQGDVAVSGNLGALALSGSNATVAGVTGTLRLTIDGVQSDAFTLTVDVNTANGVVGEHAGSPLRAWTVNGTLHAGGMKAGETWRVYSPTGALVCIGIADGSGSQVLTALPARGIYVVRCGADAVKTVFY